MNNKVFSKSWAVIIIVLFVIKSILPTVGSVFINNVSVNKNQNYSGKWLYVGGSGPGNYTTIQGAIDDANSGDTVFVYNGIYFENVIIDKSINLIGENKEETIIDGKNDDISLKLTNSNINITSFTITNSKVNEFNKNGIEAKSVNNIFIINCNVVNHSSNDSLSNTKGVFFESIFNCFFHNCYFSNNLWCNLDFENCKNVNLFNCYSEKSFCGFEITNSTYVKVFNSRFYDNEQGVNIRRSSNVDIYKNIINNNKRNGLIIHSFLDNSNIDIFDNNIIENGGGHEYFDGGILVQYCTNDVTIQNNNIEGNNPHGIYFICSVRNKIIKNNFINNSIHVVFVNLFNFKIRIFYPKNIFKYNYWDDWIGLNSGFYRFFPKVIIGSYNNILPRWQFDYSPSKKPY